MSYRVLSQYQRYSSQRDPYVFWSEVEQQYGYVMTCRVKEYDDATSGAVGYATSIDLQHWERRGDLFFTGKMREPECPQVFCIGSKWYLLASIHTGTEVGKPSYWMSNHPAGPWSVGLPDSLDGSNLAAANVSFDGRRWLLLGWIPLTTTSAHGHYTWGGYLAFPREIIQFADGRLGTQLDPGISTAIRGELLFDAARERYRRDVCQ
jgi:beta-fructofuranosidase